MRNHMIDMEKNTMLCQPVILTFRLKVKTSAYAWLNEAASEVNTVWNWANETSLLSATRTDTKRKWLGGFDLNNLSAGATEHFQYIGSDTIQRVNCTFATKRTAAKKVRLSWRKSAGTRRSLGWIPFKAASIKRTGVGLKFCGKSIRLFEADKLEGLKWKDGCFARDACGDWWACLPAELEVKRTSGICAIGIDLGLKDIAVTSDGERLPANHFHRAIESKIAQAQRRGHKRQAKTLHRRAARMRRDALHKFTTALVSRSSEIFVGDVSSAKLIKTRLAKSVLNAGWGMLKTQLRYKCQQAGAEFQEVSERFTTRTCSGCGALTGPAGLDMLSVRSWTCRDCGENHDRDVNSARNILIAGRHARPFAGTLSSCLIGAQRTATTCRGWVS